MPLQYLPEKVKPLFITDKILYASGWCRCGMAALFGCMAALAQPPVYLLLLIVPSFSGLFLLSFSAKNMRQAFSDGWWWGLGYFTAGLYWICISLYVEPEKFAWLTPFALFGLPSLLAVYTGLAVAASWRMKIAADKKILIFAGSFTLAEYARGHLLTGFPWNLTGYIWTVSDVTLQAVAVFGIYGLGFVTVYIATAPALFLLKRNALMVNLTAFLMLAAILVFGFLRLASYPVAYTQMKIRIVQPAIPEIMKMNPDTMFAIIQKQMDVTLSRPLAGIDMVIWPEVAIPWYLESGSALVHRVTAMLPEKTLLVTGALRRNPEKDVFNSLLVMDSTGSLLAHYDKHHLVPFGEFIPFRTWLPIETIAGGHGDFAHGSGATTVLLKDMLPFSPLVCYEAIFPEEATDTSHRAKWLLNITNDNWFGISSGPYQHLEMARVRAVENGLPLIRVANSGVSAVIDPLGRILETIPLGKTALLDFYLPLAKP